MTEHNHSGFVPGCYRCDISRAEMDGDDLRRTIATAPCLRDTRPTALCVRGFYKHPECVAAHLRRIDTGGIGR